MLKKIIGIILVLILIAGGVMVVRHKKASLENMPLPEKNEMAVEVVRPVYGKFYEKKRFLGTLFPKISADISPRLTGHLLEVRVRQGDVVKEGDLLALLDDRLERDKVSELKASLAAAKTNLATMENIYERDRKLFEAKALSQEALDRSLSLRDSARAQVIALEKGLHTAEINLSYTRLLAPFSGVVTGRFADPGELAVPGKPVLSLEAVEKGYFVSVRVPQALFPRLETGDRVFVYGGEGGTRSILEGTISRIHPAVRAGTLVTVEIDFNERPFGLPSGATLEVELVTGEVEGWKVPVRALLEDVDTSYLYLVDDKNSVHIKKVEIVAKGADGAVIKSGLDKDSLVIVAQESGLLRLHEGQRVKPRKMALHE